MTVGRDAVVLTASVVMRDNPEFAFVGSNSARQIGHRPKDVTHMLDWNPWVPFWDKIFWN